MMTKNAVYYISLLVGRHKCENKMAHSEGGVLWGWWYIQLNHNFI